MTTIPASELVAVNPSVLAAGGSALDVIGLILTTNNRIPIGTVQSFPDAASGSDFFGASSKEATLLGIYFNGFDNASKRPAAALMAQYPQSSVSAYLRGADVSGMTLAALQALNSALSVTIDGVVKSGTPNLASATSFSNAASIIGATLAIAGVQSAVATGSISGGTLTVSAVTSGVISVGDVVAGTGVTSATYVTALASGTGGVGTYNVSPSQSAGSEALTFRQSGVVYDSVSGAFIVRSGTTGVASTISFGSGAMATSLSLTQVLGAVLSQGVAAATPSAFMDGVISVTTDWVTFMTMFDPDTSGNTNKLAFSAWKDAQNDRYAYICWDTDVSPTTTLPANTSLGQLLEGNGDSGTSLIWASTSTTGPEFAAFVCGAAASINFDERNGRITFAYKAQAGLIADVTTASVALNLGGTPQSASRGNGYNFYGAYGSANDSFVWFQRGFVTGGFAWLDAYINQIWLNNAFQLALLELLRNTKSIPYSAAGNSLIEAALGDPIAAGLNFAAFAPGAISAAQIVEVNTDAGANIAPTLQTQGWFLQILPASSTVRAARGSPPIKFFYLDRGSVQAITLSSIAVQ